MSSITITLDPETEEKIRRLVQDRNVTIEQFIGDAVRTAAALAPPVSVARERPATGREILEELDKAGALWRIDMKEDTVEYAHRLRDRVQRRRTD